MLRVESVVRFGPFEFDFGEGVLRKEASPVALQPQPTAVLAALLRRPGRIVSRGELQEAVWHRRSASLEAGLNFNVRQVRVALEDDANTPRYIETVHRRGYRFIAPVEVIGVDVASRSRRRWAVPAAAAIFAILSGTWLAFGGRARELDGAALEEPTRTTFEAAEWLFEEGEFERSLARLDSVRLLAPRFADAWTLTARVRLRLDDPAGARAAADRAIELDATDASAHQVRGLTLFLDSRGEEALNEFERAVELDPSNASYRQWLAQTLANALHFDEAIEQLEEARRVDPIRNLVGVDLAQVYLAAGRFDDALTFCTASLELAPDGEPWARGCLMTAHHFLGNEASSIEQARALMRLAGAGAEDLARVTDLDDYFAWDLVRIGSAGEDESPFTRVRARARLRDRTATLAGLRELRSMRHFGLQWAPRDVWFRFLHGDPAFEAILREAGLPTPRPAS